VKHYDLFANEIHGYLLGFSHCCNYLLDAESDLKLE